MSLRGQFLLSGVLTLLIKLVVFLLGGTLAWWLAAVIAAAVVFGSSLAVVIDFGDGSGDSWGSDD